MGEDKSEEFDPDMTQSLASPGEWLRAARQDKGLSIGDVADHLKITPSYVQHIESNEFDRLPALTFARGYLRSYAELLDLDPEQLVAQFDQFTGAHDQDYRPRSVQTAARLSGSNRFLMRWITVIIILVIIGGSVWWWLNEKRNQTQALSSPPAATSSQTSGAVTQEPTAGAAEAKSDNTVPAKQPEPGAADTDSVVKHEPEAGQVQPETGSDQGQSLPIEPQQAVEPESVKIPEPVAAVDENQLSIEFNADCWLQVSDSGGKVLYSGVQKAGNTLNLEITKPFSVRLGNVPAVTDMRYGSKSITIPQTGRNVTTVKVG